MSALMSADVKCVFVILQASLTLQLIINFIDKQPKYSVVGNFGTSFEKQCVRSNAIIEIKFGQMTKVSQLFLRKSKT